MRAVALAQPSIQAKIKESFIPLKVVMTYPPKMTAFPLDWPAMRSWKIGYRLSEGSGFTGCSVVSPNLDVEFGSTGSAQVWELFDSVAYDSTKFEAMLDRAADFWQREKGIRDNSTLSRVGKRSLTASLHREISASNNIHGHFRLPPEGFKVEYALEIFRLTGDLPPEDPPFVR